MKSNFRGLGSVLAACVALDPGWGRYHVAETAQLLVVRKQRGRYKERVRAP